MRPKVVIIVLLVGAVCLAAILFLKPANKTPLPPAIPNQPVAVMPATNPIVVQAPTPAPVATVVPSVPKASRNPFVSPPVVGENAPYLQATIDHLDELSMNDDDASLQTILKELTNTNAIIRHEAIEATIQFGGHTAVPVLKDLASRTWDPDEKKELLDAAEFLSLPSWSEVKAQNPGLKLGQPQNPSPATDQP